MKKQREYTGEIKDYADLMTVHSWNTAVRHGCFINSDGCGYWCKNGKESDDEVFTTEQKDATHVAWYNK